MEIIRENLSGLHKNICCHPSSEQSQQDGSDEGSQHMVSMRNKKHYPSIIIKYSSNLQLCFKDRISQLEGSGSQQVVYVTCLGKDMKIH